MGRSFEVRRKSENLPVVSRMFFVFSRFGTRCSFMTWADLLETVAGLAGGEFELLIIKAAVPFVGTAAFFYWLALAIRAGLDERR